MNKCKIYYHSLTDEMRKEEKLQWFNQHKLADIPFEHIQPDKNNNWINLSEDNDWEEMIPIASKETKHSKNNTSIFKNFFPGVPTNRDEWVYDFNHSELSKKMQYFSEQYNLSVENNNIDNKIKWSRDLKNELDRKKYSNFKDIYIVDAIYRPYVKLFHYTEKILNDVLTQNHYDVYGKCLNKENVVLCVPGIGIDRPFHTLIIKNLPHLQITPNGQCLPLYRSTEAGERIENITDWALEQFQSNYSDKTITKEDIFHYVYGVLHNPEYRTKYEINLKREFPRIPFYDNFWKWAAWGKELMDLHINFEEVEQYTLIRTDIDTIEKPKCKLKVDKTAGTITLDENTVLSGVPAIAWEYKLGNRSALEWILDQYKEKKPKDPTIAEKFNTYRFADYKDKVIDLLMRVCTVSIRTMEIVGEMKGE